MSRSSRLVEELEPRHGYVNFAAIAKAVVAAPPVLGIVADARVAPRVQRERWPLAVEPCLDRAAVPGQFGILRDDDGRRLGRARLPAVCSCAVSVAPGIPQPRASYLVSHPG